MLGFIKEMFVVLLGTITNASNHMKCVPLNNQNCEIQPTLINLHPNEFNQCVGSCNTLNDLPNKVCVPKKNRRFKSKHVQHDCRNK